MNFCCSNHIRINVLRSNKMYNIHQVLSNFQQLSINEQSALANCIAFSQQGKLLETGELEKYGFKVSKNEILKEIVIDRKSKQIQISKVLQPNESFNISKGTALKFGNNQVQVFDLYPIDQHNTLKNMQTPLSPKNPQKGEEDIMRCRICFNDHETIDDPLLNFCKCSGSVKYMHLECYREWFIKKVKIYSVEKITHFQYSNIKCDLCKVAMPFSVQKFGIQYSLVDYKKEFKNAKRFSYDSSLLFSDNLSDNESFLALEELMVNHKKNQSENSFEESSRKEGSCVVLKISTLNQSNIKSEQIIVIKMMEDELYTIGTDYNCKVVLNSPSVSPQHAALYLREGKVYIEDFFSQFGTFIMLKGKKDYSFESKDGFLFEHNNGEYVMIKQKTGIFSFLEPNISYVLRMQDH